MIWPTSLFDQAVLAEGGQLEDPAAFVQRVTRSLSGSPAERGGYQRQRLGLHRLDLLAQLGVCCDQ